ncbi:hypothetical protein L7F22_045685 [Adiantum nelumboides]|nr:hypothetical protein [Adiantum nelumboides]
MASSEGQSNPSTSGDAGGNHNEDYGNEYGPPLPSEDKVREMEHRRLVGEATNMMLNFAKNPKLAKYMTETAFQDVHAQWKATTTSPPKFDSKKQYSEKELKQEVEAWLAQIFDAHKKGKKFGITQDLNEETEKKRARAARFGIVDEDAKKKARLERFKESQPEDKEEFEKRKARALRFAPSTEQSLAEPIHD